MNIHVHVVLLLYVQCTCICVHVSSLVPERSSIQKFDSKVSHRNWLVITCMYIYTMYIYIRKILDLYVHVYVILSVHHYSTAS